eukprot:6371047-Prorocentrum_lima.AAC.1
MLATPLGVRSPPWQGEEGLSADSAHHAKRQHDTSHPKHTPHLHVETTLANNFLHKVRYSASATHAAL